MKIRGRGILGAESLVAECTSIGFAFWVTARIFGLTTGDEIGAASHGTKWPFPIENAHYLVLLLASLLLWVFIRGYGDLRQDTGSGGSNEWRRQGLRWLTSWIILTAGATFFLKIPYISRRFGILFFAIASGEIILLRELHLRRRTADMHGTGVILGTGDSAQKLAEVLSARGWRCRIVNLADLGATLSKKGTGNSTGLDPRCREDEFFIVGAGGEDNVGPAVLALAAARKTVHLVPAVIDTKLFWHSLSDIQGVPAITLSSGFRSRTSERIKRALDVVGAAILIVLLAPLMGFIALLVKISSPGPVLFRQERLGKSGARFRMLKFRSMRVDTEKILRSDKRLYESYAHNNFKLTDCKGEFVTPIGRLLRILSLDELPQLFNVVKGDMSLVGPRPIVPEEIACYGEYAPLFLSVKPGITGHWQTSGRSRIRSYEQRVYLDMEYIRDQSLRKDLSILLKTVASVVRMDGSE